MTEAKFPSIQLIFSYHAYVSYGSLVILLSISFTVCVRINEIRAHEHTIVIIMII